MCSSSTSNSESRFPLGILAVRRLDRAGNARAARGVQRRQSERVLRGLLSLLVEIRRDVEQQVVAVGHDLGDAGVGPVGLVDDEDDGQVRGERLAQHEAGLRQRSFGGVDEQQHAVDHREAAFHLAAEVGVAGCVDDVDDRHRAVRVLPMHGGVLRQDRDALFLLEVAGVHQAFDCIVTAVVQGTGLPQHRIDQGRLAMIDVSDDGDVTKIHVNDCRSVGNQSRKRSKGIERVREVQQIRRGQTQEEVLPVQAAMQALPGGAAQGPDGRTVGVARQGPAEGLRTCAKVLTTSTYGGVRWMCPALIGGIES
jgi:hypothetical protein